MGSSFPRNDHDYFAPTPQILYPHNTINQTRFKKASLNNSYYE